MKKLTEEFNSISVKKGETFSIELDANRTTGHRWALQLNAGKATLMPVDNNYVTYVPAEPMTVGSGGKEIFVFKANEVGVIEIETQYKRVGDKGPPEKVQKFSVTVK